MKKKKINSSFGIYKAIDIMMITNIITVFSKGSKIKIFDVAKQIIS